MTAKEWVVTNISIMEDRMRSARGAQEITTAHGALSELSRLALERFRSQDPKWYVGQDRTCKIIYPL